MLYCRCAQNNVKMSLKSSHIEESFITTDEDIKILLSHILHLNLQNSSSEKLILNLINKLLSASKTRLQGLEFLNLIIDNCSKTSITENAITWIACCVVKYSGDNLKEIKLSTIGKIIENSYNEQEFNKRFIADYISKILESCISTHGNCHETEAALQTLTICMKYYSSWFTLHKEKIENFIITFLESPFESVVKKAGFAFLYLQEVGGAGIDGINHKINFSTNFTKLCATVQKLFDKFFENETELDNSETSNADAIIFKDLSHHSQKMLHIVARRITNCLIFLRIMLLRSFPVSKDVKPMEILDIIGRGTALHHCLTIANDKSLTDFQFSLLLNKVQIQLLQLLRILLLWLEESSLPFSFTISKIIMDSLKKIQNCQCFTTDSLYQEVVYKVLGCWLRVSKNSFHTHFQSQLVTCILKDITPTKNKITLILQTDTKSKSGKAKRKFIQDRIISSGQGGKMEKLRSTEKANQEKNCLFALDALKQILIATTIKLKANKLQDLYTTIINIILDIQASNFSHPYTHIDCQEKLYEVLVAFYEQETLKASLPLQLSIDVLNKGVNNRNRHIALTCEQGLSIVEKLCQPLCPTLFMPEMFASEHLHKSDMVFDKHILDNLTNQNWSGNEKNDVLEDTSILNGALEKYEVVTEAEKGNRLELDEVVGKTNTEIEFEVNEEVVDEEIDVEIEETNKNKTNSLETLAKEKSIHIIDMQVVRANELRSDENIELPNNVTDDLSKGTEGIISTAMPSFCDENIAIKSNILKTEVVSGSNLDLADNMPNLPLKETNPIDDSDKIEDEPPSKKSRVEEEGEFLNVEVKEELTSSEEVDDIFKEDGAFVDEVKDY